MLLSVGLLHSYSVYLKELLHYPWGHIGTHIEMHVVSNCNKVIPVCQFYNGLCQAIRLEANIYRIAEPAKRPRG